MEDASAVDLDWFWRAWFFTTDYVDISLDEVNWYELNTMNPDIEMSFKKEQNENKDQFIGDTRNKAEVKETVNERDGDIDDFYGKRDVYAVDRLHLKEYAEFKEKLSGKELELLNSGLQFYELKFSNLGGIPMPLILRFTFIDGSNEVVRIPAEIWRRSEKKVSKVFMFQKEVESIRLDPFLETADTDLNNNSWPEKRQPTRYELFKKRNKRENPMQRQKRLEELED
jgi:hypothetical protein